MGRLLSLDEDLLRRLPLPLAQMARRAHNAKTPLERNHAAYYLWEATLKLLVTLVVIGYANHKSPHPQAVRTLQALARPTVGHWWEFTRSLLSLLAGDGRAELAWLRDWVQPKPRDD